MVGLREWHGGVRESHVEPQRLRLWWILTGERWHYVIWLNLDRERQCDETKKGGVTRFAQILIGEGWHNVTVLGGGWHCLARGVRRVESHRGRGEVRGVGIWTCGKKRHFILFGSANSTTGSENSISHKTNMLTQYITSCKCSPTFSSLENFLIMKKDHQYADIKHWNMTRGH